jgi:hypothetical protein
VVAIQQLTPLSVPPVIHQASDMVAKASMKFVAELVALLVISGTMITSATTAISEVSEFRATTRTYTELDDHAEACVAEFGVGSRKADWDTDLGQLTDVDIDALISQTGIELNGQSHWVLKGGQDRQYFFQRLDGDPPSSWVPWVVHDAHGAISLGSWYGIMRTSAISYPVLCVEPGSLHAGLLKLSAEDGASGGVFTTTQTTTGRAWSGGPARRVEEVLSSGASKIAGMCAPMVALLVSQVVLS